MAVVPFLPSAPGRDNDFPTMQLPLFVYGTLKYGGARHDLCRGLLDRESAVIPGRLFLLPEGYPGLDLPAAAVLGRAGADHAADRARLAGRGPPARPGLLRPEDLWIEGEWMLLACDSALAAIDEWEDVAPGRSGVYERVLSTVALPRQQAARHAWVYRLRPPLAPGLRATRLTRWPPPDPAGHEATFK
ncbi:MAG: gamma-glutamylcyclotransferase [Puniceicoccaceae bacterium]|nr:MAG: gamma-glutamylcyclotransferase [Puniceicoccaceae bacterium]